MADSTSNDIRERMMKSRTGVIGYASNVGKSFLNMSTYMVSSSMPTLFSYGEVNKEVITSTVGVLKNPRKALGSKISAALNSEVTSELGKVGKYILDDLKTGKFFDNYRDRTNVGLETESLLDDFGGLDMSDYGSTDEYGDFDVSESSNDHQFDLDLADAQNEQANIRTEATIGAVAASTESIIRNENENHAQDIRLRLKQHDQSMTGMNNIVMASSANYEMTSTLLTEMLNLTRDANNEIISRLETINTTLTEIKDLNMKNNELQSGLLLKDTDELELPLKNGVLDIKKYVKTVMKNVDTKFGVGDNVSMLTQGMKLTDLVELYKSNPLGGLLTSAIRGMAPDGFFENLTKKDKSLKNFGPALLNKLAGMKNKDGSDSLLQLLGVKSYKDDKVITEYNMGVMEYNGRADKAITEVMPFLLSKIYSAISGEELKVYDYKQGKFVKAKDEIKKIQNTLNNNDAYSKVNSAVSKRLDYINTSTLNTNKKKNDFINEIDAYLQEAANNQEMLNIFDLDKEMNSSETRALANRIFKGGNQVEKLNLLMGIIRSMPREELIELAGKPLTGINDVNRNIRNMNKGLGESGLISLLNDFDDDLKDYGKKYQDNKYSSDEEINKKLKSYGKLSLPDTMTGILNALNRGIVTYSYNMSDIDNVPQNIRNILSDEQTKVIDKISDEYKEEQRKIREREERDNEQRNLRDEALPLGGASAEAIANSLRNMDNEEKEKKEEEAKRKKNSFLGNFMSESSINKISSFKSTVSEPFNAVTQMLSMTENAMFKFLYGEQYADELANLPETGLIGTMGKLFTGLYTKTNNYIGELLAKNMVDPLIDKLFNEEKGVFPKLYNKFFKDKVDGKLSDAKNKLLGTREEIKDEEGNVIGYTDYEGGYLSNSINRNKKWYNDKLKPKMNEYKSKFSETILGDLRLGLFGDRDGPEDKKGLFNGLIDGIKSSFGKFKDWLFGKNEDGTDTDDKKLFDEIAGEINKASPDMVVQAGIGAGVATGFGLLTGMFLPGGPITGAIIGSFTGLVTGSDKLKNFLFGEEGLDNDLIKGFKEKAPKVGIGMGIGALAGGIGLLPFGLGGMSGAILGSLGGLIAGSDQLKEIFFGKKDDKTGESGLFSKKDREKFFKTVLPVGVGGAAAGFLASMVGNGIGAFFGLPFIPGGPIVAMITGLTAAFNADSIKDFFFGNGEDKKDKDGKVIPNSGKEGIFKKMFENTKDEIFKPLIKGINESSKNIKNWFQEDIVNQLKDSMQPFKEEVIKAGDHVRNAFMNIGDSIRDSLSSVFGGVINKPLNEFMKEYVLDPLKKRAKSIISGLGSILGSVISAPFKAFNQRYNPDAEGKPMSERDRKRNERRMARSEERFKRAEERKEKRRLKAMDPEQRADERTDKSTDRISNSILSLKPFLSAIRDTILNGSNSSSGEEISNEVGISTLSSAATNTEDIDKKLNNNSSKQDKKAKKRDRDRERIKERTRKREERDQKLQDRQDAREERRNEKDDKANIKDDNKRGKNVFNDIGVTAKYIKRLYEFSEAHLSGIGYDVRYIRNMLAKQYGELDTSELPEEGRMKNETGYSRRGNIFKRGFRKASDLISDGLFSAKLWASEKLEGAKGFMSTLFAPITLLKKMITGTASMIGDTLKGLGSFTKELFGEIKDNLFEVGSGFATMFKDTFVGLGTIIKEASSGVGEGIGLVFKEAAGIFSEILGIGKGLLAGLSEASQILIPELVAGFAEGLVGAAKGIWGATKWTAKTLWKGAKWVGSGAKGLYDKFKGRSSSDPNNPMSNVQSFRLDGGFLDNIINPIPVELVSSNASGSNKPLTMVNIKNFTTVKNPKEALPVYIAGSYENNKQNIRSKVRAYRNTSRRVESNTNENRDVYDSLMDNANSINELNAITQVHQLNTTQSEGSNTNTETIKEGESSGGFLASLLGLDGDSGLSGTSPFLASLFGSGIGSMIPKIAKGIGSIGKGLLPIAGATLPWLLGNQVASANGDEEQIAYNNTRFGVRTADKLLTGKAGQTLMNSKLGNKAMEELLTNPKTAGIAEKFISTTYDDAGKAIYKQNTGNILKTAGNAIKETATNSARMIGDGINKAAAGAADDGLFNKAKSFIKNIMNKFFKSKEIIEQLGKSTAEKLSSNVITKALAKVTKTAIGRIAAKVTATIASGGVSLLAFAILDFGTGMAQADNIFRVRSGTSDLKMRIAAGVGKALSGVVFGLVSEDWLAGLVYPLLASEEEEADLANNQAELATLAEEAGMSAEDYSDNVENATWFTKISNTYKKNIDAIEESTGLQLGITDLLNPFKALENTKTVASGIWDFFTGDKDENGQGNGRGESFKQTDSRWNTNDNKYLDMAESGCGPTVAAMMVNGRGSNNPVEAARMANMLNYRDDDGGTQPGFFNAYGKKHGVNMEEGNVDLRRINDTLSSGGKVAFMGQGGVFGKGMHYVMGDSIDKSGMINIVDPLGKKSKSHISNVAGNSKTAIYRNKSGKGDEETTETTENSGSFFDNVMGFLSGTFSGVMSGLIGERWGSTFNTQDYISGSSNGYSSNSSSSYGTTGSSYVYSMDYVMSTTEEKELSDKVLELIKANEAGGDYTKAHNDTNSGTGQTVGPSIGIMQWHAGRITEIMERMNEKIGTDESRYWALYDWSANIPMTNNQLSRLTTYLKNNLNVTKEVQDTIIRRDSDNLILYIRNANILSDPKAIAMLADMFNTASPTLKENEVNSIRSQPKAINSLDGMYTYLTTNSWWARSEYKNGYNNRVKRSYDILSKWNIKPPTVSTTSSQIPDVAQWFVQNMPNAAYTQEFKGAGVHEGIDIGGTPAGALKGAAIPSPVNGVVSRSYLSDSAGNSIVVTDSNNHDHWFMHMIEKSKYKNVGDTVKQGEIIGNVGNTGQSFGNHLHYEVNPTGTLTGIDPISYIAQLTSTPEYTTVSNLKNTANTATSVATNIMSNANAPKQYNSNVGVYGSNITSGTTPETIDSNTSSSNPVMDTLMTSGRGGYRKRFGRGKDIDKYVKPSSEDLRLAEASLAKNEAYSQALRTNMKVLEYERDKQNESKYAKLQKEVDKIADSKNGKGDSDNALLKVMSQMLEVLKNIEINTANINIPSQTTTATTKKEPKTATPIGTGSNISTGAYTIDLLTAK